MALTVMTEARDISEALEAEILYKDIDIAEANRECDKADKSGNPHYMEKTRVELDRLNHIQKKYKNAKNITDEIYNLLWLRVLPEIDFEI